MLPALVHLLVLLSGQPEGALTSRGQGQPSEPSAGGLEAATLPRCSAEVARCAAIRLWVTPQADDFDDVAFVTAQLEQANAHHGPAGLGFEVVEVELLPATATDIVTRSDRDLLGHDRWQRGLVDVYIVSSLANVDEPGAIRGVHWRSRKDRARRWVILSRISAPRVLAHELGHYFGLAHSTVPASLMNTSGNALADRRFQPAELTKIEQRAKLLFAQRVVTDPRTPDRVHPLAPGPDRPRQPSSGSTP